MCARGRLSPPVRDVCRQVLVLLYAAHCMVNWMWKQGVDPDNSAIPYLTAVCARGGGD